MENLKLYNVYIHCEDGECFELIVCAENIAQATNELIQHEFKLAEKWHGKAFVEAEPYVYEKGVVYSDGLWDD